MVLRGRFSSIDAAVLMTLASRLWSILAGLVMVAMIATHLTKVEQGYYFTFASLLGLQIFFELGLNFVLTQFASHEAINTHWLSPINLSGSDYALNRIVNLLLMVRRWFLIGSAIFTAAVSIGGYFFLQRPGQEPEHWVIAWLAMCFAAGVNLYLSPKLAICEGIGRIRDVAKLRLVQSIIGYSVCWTFMIADPSLYTVAFIPVVAAITSLLWLQFRSGLPQLQRLSHSTANAISWRHQIFPMQWRIALSWISGYMIFQLFTPMVFAHQGPVEAGKLGLSLALFTNITNVSMSLLAAKAPEMGGMVAAYRRDDLRRLFSKLFILSAVFNLTLSVVAVVIISGLSALQVSYVTRVLSPKYLALLAVIGLANQTIFAMATYMRAHKQEPMLWNSLTSGVCIGISTYLGSFVGVGNILLGYLLVTLLVSLPWTLLLMRPFWSETDHDKGLSTIAEGNPQKLKTI